MHTFVQTMPKDVLSGVKGNPTLIAYTDTIFWFFLNLKIISKIN
jgi:hypothetical protein